MVEAATVLAALAVLVLASALYLFCWPRVQRRWILRRSFPADWEALLNENLPSFRRAPEALRVRWRALIQLFLWRKRFVPCAGLRMEARMAPLIAAQACLLVLNRPSREFADLYSVYLYPTVFRVRHQEEDESGVVTTDARDLMGESWERGQVVLAWDDVEHSLADPGEGYNVVLHEFAHQLDHETGVDDGCPLLPDKGMESEWRQLMESEYRALQREEAPAILDPYGATQPAEFFAVATETFFERPHALQQYHPHLFDLLHRYYQLDPRPWQRGIERVMD